MRNTGLGEAQSGIKIAGRSINNLTNSKESICSAGDLSLIPGSERSPGEGKGYPLQYSWASLVAQLVKNLPEIGRASCRERV